MMKNVAKQKVIVIAGPTASGKSALAVEVARAVNGEVISADSRQVYRGLDIGTGKVTAREMKGVPHHLLDVASPKRVFNADDFIRHGRKAIEDISRRGRVPVIAGGTGFYIDALVGNIVLPNVPPNATLRKKLSWYSAEKLYSLLQKKDPERAHNIDEHNPVRLIRALEIAEAVGTSPSPRTESHYDVLWVGIDVPKDELNIKIEKRLKERMKRGMLSEARRLHAKGLSWKRMEELGLEYRYMARLLKKKITRAQFERDLATEIRRYAKRQRMYWRRNKEIRWFTPEKLSGVVGLVRKFLQ